MTPYMQERSSTRRPCVLSRLRMAHAGGVYPKRIQEVCGPEATKIVADPLRWICKDDRELEEISRRQIEISRREIRARSRSRARRISS